MDSSKMNITDKPKNIADVDWQSKFLPSLSANATLLTRTSDSRIKIGIVGLAFDPRFFNIYISGKRIIKMPYSKVETFYIVTPDFNYIVINDRISIKTN